MSLTRGPTEGGSGGRRDHSNMEHWGYTDEIKFAARKLRRIRAKKLAKDALDNAQSATHVYRRRSGAR
jgi:hypothetical protein